jgi:hypothetical protein
MPFAAAASLLANLGSFGKNFVGVDSPKYVSPEYLASTVTSMSADMLAGVASGAQLAGAKIPVSGTTGRTHLDLTSWILWALVAVELLELTTGFGPPTEGDALKDGAQQFTAAAEQLKSAIPGDQWQGPASRNYADLGSTLEDLATTMAELDLKLAGLVKFQAEWVTHFRLGFGILKDLLIVAYVIELYLKATTVATLGGGMAAAQIFAITVSVIALSLAALMLTALGTISGVVGGEADDVTAEYAEVAGKAKEKPSDTPPAEEKMAPATESRVSSIEDISAGTSDISAMALSPESASVADRPKLASVAGEGASADERAPLRALAGEAETLGDGSPETPEAPETPDGATPSTPSMPSMAQLAQMSGQAAKLSGHASQHMNLVNQTMGQIQQLAQMAQQGQGAAAPAEEAAVAEAAPAEAALVGAAPAEAALVGAAPAEARFAGDVEGAGAALGTEAAERAPIDAAAVGAEQAREPRRYL